MDHLRSALAHDEGRLLDRVVADRDDQIGPVDRPVDVVALRQRRRAHVEVGAAGDGALAHLRVEERQARAAHEARQRLDQPRTVAAGADHDQRALGRKDHLGRAVEGGRMRDRALDRVDRHDRRVAGSTSSAATSSGSSRWTGPGRSSIATRKASRTMVGMLAGADDLPRHLGQRLHRGDDVDDLEPRLPGGHDRPSGR